MAKKIEEIKRLIYEAYVEKNLNSLDEIQEYYTYGNCMYLAIALNRIYGFEIQAAIVNQDSVNWIGHAWVKLPGGNYIDIMGLYTDTVELDGFGDKTITNMTEDNLCEYMENLNGIEKEIKKAEIVAKCIVSHLDIEGKYEETTHLIPK